MTRQYSDQGYHAEVRAREASAAPAALFKRAFWNLEEGQGAGRRGELAVDSDGER